MLRELYIENLAVIKKSVITFDNNLNVFTGETGAGKSILINGINAVLGQRTSKDIVRTGADKAVIVALFTDIPDNVRDKLSEYGFELSDNELSVTREIFSDGGSVARINSRTTTVTALREIGELLINIHGQHDNQILLSAEKHLVILDSFGELDEILSDYHEAFRQLQETARTINRIISDEREKSRRISELNDIVEEIEALDISDNEDSEIEDEFQLLKDSARISEAVFKAYTILSGNDELTGAIVMADDAAEAIMPLSGLLADLEPLSKRLKDSSVELDDISSELNRLLESLDFEPGRFEFLKNRRDELNRIKRKYGPELSDVLDTYNKSTKELELLDGDGTELEKLKEKKQELLAQVTAKAKLLSDERKKAADCFIEKVTAELSFLDMPGVKLEVLSSTGKLTVNGMDNVEFLISANPGEPPKPIAKIASGGELSRIMLALKNVLAGKDNIPTLIFDEIDTGVSGRAAQKIGIKLSEISRHRQVLCVTHLAQIAVMADTHLYIEKNVVESSTLTTVKKLDFEERKHEIARIMGGDKVTELLLKNAEELILTSKSFEEKG